MYLTETHLHTYPTSGCSKFSPREAVERYRAAGYHTLFITDHFSKRFGFDTELSWEGKLDLFFAGYEEAKTIGEAFGMCILPSMELTLKTSRNDYLLYGVTKTFFLDKPHVFEMTPQEVYTIAREAEIFVVQAHPMRDQKCVPTPDAADAFEAVNTNPRHENFDAEVTAIAKAHGLFITSGSDAHRPEDVARGGIMTEQPIHSVADYINALKTGACQMIGGYLPYDISDQ